MLKYNFGLRCFVTETSIIRFLFPCHCGGGGGGGGGRCHLIGHVMRNRVVHI